MLLPLQTQPVDPAIARRIDPVAPVNPTVAIEPLVPVGPQTQRPIAPAVLPADGLAVRVPRDPLRGLVGPSVAAGRAAAEQAALGLPAATPAADLALSLQDLVQRLLALGVTGVGDAALPLLDWPAPQTQPLAQTPAAALAVLRDSLAQSPLLLRPGATPADPQLAATPVATAAATPADAATEAPALAPAAAPDQRAALSAATLAYTAAAAQADGPPVATQALQLLMHGQLRWAGELTPGVPAQVQREDAWDEDPQHPGRLRQGAALRIDLDLPTAGRLSLLAQCVGGHCSVQLLTTPEQAGRFEAALPLLRDALALNAREPVALQLYSAAPAAPASPAADASGTVA